jgi:hypothetical protein
MNDRILGHVDQETGKLTEIVDSLRKDTQQKIGCVNDRVEAIAENMKDKFEEI